MRTTVDLDEDVLMAAKELARLRGESIGRVISDAVRLGLSAPHHGMALAGAMVVSDTTAEDVLARFGFEPLPHRGKLVTNELIDQIRDDEGL